MLQILSQFFPIWYEEKDCSWRWNSCTWSHLKPWVFQMWLYSLLTRTASQQYWDIYCPTLPPERVCTKLHRGVTGARGKYILHTRWTGMFDAVYVGESWSKGHSISRCMSLLTTCCHNIPKHCWPNCLVNMHTAISFFCCHWGAVEPVYSCHCLRQPLS